MPKAPLAVVRGGAQEAIVFRDEGVKNIESCPERGWRLPVE
jgi:hypothetical protein